MRRQELGETTKQACVAITIDTLKSLRGNTKVAKTRADDIQVSDVTSRYTPSISRHGKEVKRVLRSGPKGHGIQPPKDHLVIWNVKKYRKHEQYFSYIIIDRRASDVVYKYFIVAKSENAAVALVRRIHAGRVKKHRKLAKYALGVAMNKVSTQQKVSDNIEAKAMRTGLNNIKVKVEDTGGKIGDEGEVSIYVHDAIQYAGNALNGGMAYVNQAQQSAMNKVAGMIIQKLKRAGKITDEMKVTADDLLRGL